MTLIYARDKFKKSIFIQSRAKTAVRKLSGMRFLFLKTKIKGREIF